MRRNPFNEPVRANPYAKPSPTTAFGLHHGHLPGVIELYIYEPDDIDRPEYALVAGMILSFNGAQQRWEASGVAACPGYGPLIYELMATLLQHPVYGTRDQSEAAKGFWKHQKQSFINPLSRQEFFDKYGTTIEAMEGRGYELTPEELRRFRDQTVSVFFEAKEAEKEGKPLSLPRCLP
jgi:hypothetical protein